MSIAKLEQYDATDCNEIYKDRLVDYVLVDVQGKGCTLHGVNEKSTMLNIGIDIFESILTLNSILV